MNAQVKCPVSFLSAKLGMSRGAWRLWLDTSVANQSYFFAPLVSIVAQPANEMTWREVRADYKYQSLPSRIFRAAVLREEEE
jgi:hypothetical protein